MSAQLAAPQISLFLLVLVRASGLVVSAPIIGDAQVPRMVKAVLAVLLALLLVQVPGLAHGAVPVDLAPFTVAVVVQLVIGIALGLVARVIFLGVQTAAGIVSLQVGLTLAAVLNPLTREPDSPLAQLYAIVAALAFLAVHGDVLVLAALSRSFDLAPVTAGSISPALLGAVAGDLVQVTQLGLQIALPIGVSLFAANLVLGLVSRSLPQLNLYVLSMPINLMLGLLALIGSLGGMLLVVEHFAGDVPGAMLNILSGSH